MNALTRLFSKPEPMDRRRAARHPGLGLVALTQAAAPSAPWRIKDISATGMYLLTPERWPSGMLVPFTVQRSGDSFESAPESIVIQASAVRSGEDGVGFCFALPQGVDAAPWTGLVEDLVQDAEPSGDFVAPFRIAQAIAFLRKICPSAETELRLLTHSQRVANAVDILLKAEELVRALPRAERTHVHPFAVTATMHHGSWCQETWIRELWAGLLTASFSPLALDDSNRRSIDLFSQLSPEHVRILKSACSGCGKYVSEDGEILATPLVCTPEEMGELAGTRNLLRVARTLRHLSNLGLVKKQAETPSLLESFETAVTPTSFGLQLYAECNGVRSPHAFYQLPPPLRFDEGVDRLRPTPS
jgi:hypothetical protein